MIKIKFIASILMVWSCASFAQIDTHSISNVREYLDLCDRPAYKSEPELRSAVCAAYVNGMKTGFEAGRTLSSQCISQIKEISPLRIHAMLQGSPKVELMPIENVVELLMYVAAPKCRNLS